MTSTRLQTTIDFAVRHPTAKFDEITRRLAVSAATGFSRGDEFLSRTKTPDGFTSVPRRRPYTVWRLSTSDLFVGPSLDDHASLLLSRLAPALPAIRDFLADENYFLKVLIWHVGEGGFSMNARRIARLAAICREMHVVCWTPEEAA